MNLQKMRKKRMLSDGLVSIIMPSYNTASFISQSIDSVLAQTYENWELIIVDDCSTDETKEVVSNYQKKDDRIHFFVNEKNSGAAISRNKAIELSKGEWIAFLDSDDIWEKDKLKNQILFMEKNRYDFTYTKYEEINDKSEPLGIIVSGPKKIKKWLMYGYCWPGCLTVMYNQKRIGKIKVVDIKKNNDYAMWLKISKKANCFLYPEVLGYYRKRSGSISNHSYLQLIKWHFKLFRYSEDMNAILSSFFTVVNLVFGCIKKVVFKKNYKLDTNRTCLKVKQ